MLVDGHWRTTTIHLLRSAINIGGLIAIGLAHICWEDSVADAAEAAVEAAEVEAEVAVVEAAAVAEVRAAAKAEAEAEAEARLTWLRHEPEEDVGAVASIVEGALRLTRPGLDKEGTLHLARLAETVASAVRVHVGQEGSSRAAAVTGMPAAWTTKPWEERKRLFDPGGEWGVSMMRCECA